MEVTSQRKTIAQRLTNIVKSKVLVVLSLIMISFGLFSNIGKAKADDNYNLSTVYQYFLLDNRNGYTPKKDKSFKDAISGALGSGGNQGTFSYDDIVNGAGSKNRNSAKKFCGIMSTLSGYGYISTTNQGIFGIGEKVSHVINGSILLIFGVIQDLLDLMWAAFVLVVTQFNFYSFIAGIFGQTNAADKLSSALGISKGTVEQIVALAFGVLTMFLLVLLIYALRKGNDVDKSAMKNLVTRFIGAAAMPLTMMFCGLLISDFIPADMAKPSSKPIFANYLIDQQTWAEKENFDMTVGGINQISGSNADGTYLNTSYNPYAQNSKAYAIGQKLYKDSGVNNGAFPNTAIAMRYLSGKTFNAQDYLASIQEPGKINSINTRVANFSKDNYKALYTFDEGYTSTGTKMDGWANDKSPMSQAKDDYYTGKPGTKDFKALQNQEQTWIDRYIYGAKATGNIKDYYEAGPSKEQVFAGAGGSNDRFSDASMYLILCTQFSEKGGTFSIATPAQGAYGSIAQFAYQSPVWSEVSMVGTPVFTIPAMISNTTVALLIGLAMIVAIWSIGILEMNLLPLRAWFKIITVGSLEYTYASIVYATGVAGTLMTMSIFPRLLMNILNVILTTVFTPLTQGLTSAAGGVPTASGTEMLGISNWITMLIGIAGVLMFLKNAKFRDSLIQLMCIPWLWAKSVGEKFENQASGGTGSKVRNLMKGDAQRREKHRQFTNDALEHLSKGDTTVGRLANKFTNGAIGRAARAGLAAQAMTGSYGKDKFDKLDGGLGKHDNIKRALHQQGVNERLENALSKATPKNLKSNFDKIAKDLPNEDDQFKPINENGEFDENGKLNADDPRLTEEERQEAQEINDQQEQLDQEQQELDEAQKQLDAEKEELERAHKAGEISDDEYEKRKAELEKRQAEHDAKQEAHNNAQNVLNARKRALMDKVNGTASLDENGKFDPNNPNLTPIQAQQAKQLNSEQDDLDSVMNDLEKAKADGSLNDKEYERLKGRLDQDSQELAQKHRNGEVTGDEYLRQKNALDKKYKELARQHENGELGTDQHYEERKQELNKQQNELDLRKQKLISDVAQTAQGRPISVSQLRNKTNELVENARGAVSVYKKNPNAQTAQNVVQTFQDMQKQAKRLGTTTKELYGFDVQQRINDVVDTQYLPDKMGTTSVQVTTDDDGSQTIEMQRPLGRNSYSNNSSNTVANSRTSQTRNKYRRQTMHFSDTQSRPTSVDPASTAQKNATRRPKVNTTLSKSPRGLSRKKVHHLSRRK
ncbi:hypothetical protein ACWCL1_08120 [Ligilactobacillus sp. LYQ135]